MNSKKSVLTAVVICLYVLIIGCTMFMIITGRTLYLSGYFMSEFALGFAVFSVLILANIIIRCIGFFRKGKNSEERGAFDIVTIIVSCVILVFAVMGFVRQAGSSVSSAEIKFPDGNSVLLNEKVSSGNGMTSLDVYKADGIIAKKIGGIYGEDILSDNFIEGSGWDFTYDEEEKLFTIICYYDDEDSIFFDEEYGIGIWEEYFILE